MNLNLEVNPVRVLIVDDLPQERRALKRAVSSVAPDCAFTEADSFESGLHMVQEAPEAFDLAVVDVVLPVRTEGLELVSIVKSVLRRATQTRIIVVTAYPEVKDACTSYEAGAEAYMSKLDPDFTVVFQEKVKKLLERRELRDSIHQQTEAQRRADDAFEAHREEWVEKYGGMFIMARGEEVLLARRNPRELWEELNRLPTDDRLEIGVVEIPRKGLEHADR